MTPHHTTRSKTPPGEGAQPTLTADLVGNGMPAPGFFGFGRKPRPRGLGVAALPRPTPGRGRRRRGAGRQAGSGRIEEKRGEGVVGEKRGNGPLIDVHSDFGVYIQTTSTAVSSTENHPARDVKKSAQAANARTSSSKQQPREENTSRISLCWLPGPLLLYSMAPAPCRSIRRFVMLPAAL